MTEETLVQEEEIPGIPVKLPDGTEIYRILDEEKDDAFYNIIALMSWSKTFKIPSKKIALTFSTITDEEKHKMLAHIKSWSNEHDPTQTQFESFMTKMQLAYYLSTIELNGSIINLRDQDIEKRIEYLGKMVEQSLIFFNIYYIVFMEIVRQALMDPIVVKNS